MKPSIFKSRLHKIDSLEINPLSKVPSKDIASKKFERRSSGKIR